MGSITDNESGGRYSYRMSKVALNAAGKSLSIDLQSHDIAVILIHPGWVRTDIGGQNATTTPEAAAHGIMDLINDTHYSTLLCIKKVIHCRGNA